MFQVNTDYPVALDSPDHLVPHGTMRDNSVNPAFNRKLYQLISKQSRICDLGCAGGGFVRACVRDGYKAIGIEGSDYSKIMGRAEWAAIPHLLFTADLTRPFSITEDRLPALFDVVTGWELMEHIPEDRLGTFFENLDDILHPFGRFIASIATFSDPPWHVTVKTPDWWLCRFHDAGLEMDGHALEHFGGDWVRGGDRRFHVVMRRIHE